MPTSSQASATEHTRRDTQFTTCHHCRTTLPADETIEHDGHTSCTDCVVTCEWCQDAVHLDEAHSFEDQLICTPCLDECTEVCTRCNRREMTEQMASVDESDLACESCRDECTIVCERCACRVWEDTVTYAGDCPYCEECSDDCLSFCENCETYYADDCCPCCEGEYPPDYFHVSAPTYDVVRSQRKFGVELETADCPGYDARQFDIQSAHFGAKPDGSISGMEFTSAVLFADKGLDSIRRLCAIAHDEGWDIDRSCGFHLHVDMSDTTESQALAVARAYLRTQEIWQTFVPASRRRNSFCSPVEWDIDGTYKALSVGELWYGGKYYWLNVMPYYRLKTFEIRLHTSTLNADKVGNWVKAHCRFVDCMLAQFDRDDEFTGGDIERQWRELQLAWNDRSLAQFYRERARTFGTTLSEPLPDVSVPALVADVA